MYTAITHDSTEASACVDDEANCEEHCKSTGGFYCGTFNSECIGLDRVCDGIPDCTFMFHVDYSRPQDEMDCGTCTGQWESMRTYIAAVLPIMGAQNTEEDVYDHVCSTGACTSSFFFCDDGNQFECGNWEDEQDCEAVQCLGLKCEETHKCGPFSAGTCDGIPNCLDLTDEKDCGRC
ncbi:low-density lipoprotein receptor-related protein 1B-like [Branchiostoma floridae]|uniref:Low-density lipoprotein receptor-related protein 1B-like n=1 Tax=Branchiostoma floridae TaxID=7739 RepID=A0A9J7HSQ6_BRAFL|nr:low-density lipoprotein receptor-related protein 1B-like [Branchiostoma floridae]